MGKYEPLAKHLKTLKLNEWVVPLDEIEDVLGFGLPPSARRHRSWWSNSYRGNHSQAEGWIGAGWETRDIDLRKGTIRFEKRKNRSELKSDVQGLWTRASEISGIVDLDELTRRALTEFIHAEAGRRLIAMGGTMPDAEAAPRKRPWK